MTSATTLQTQDTTLREQFADTPDAVESAQIEALLASVQQTGKTTSSIQEREQLLGILQYWAPIVEEKTGEHPGTKLSPYDPDAEIDEEETAVSPPLEDTPTDNEAQPTLTYTVGQPQEGQPQTLAQLFMTMPTAAKVIILILIALVLATIIYWILSPKSEQIVDDVPATETAVAAVITASAQPTGTATPTATPRIYIESETAVAESIPIGSPTPIIYIIQKGDTLNKVARKYGVSVQDIVALNSIYNPNNIPIGQELLIPTPGPGTSMPVNATTNVTTTAEAEITPAAPQTEPSPQENAPSSTVSELVIRGTEPVALRIAAGPDYQAITTLPQGTFATIIAKTPDGKWFLIQLEDGFTRGWVSAEFTAIIYPANPNNIPTTPVP